ncbi:hypothetical protein SAMN02745724_03496 [Pseudoalteromonas denitrificans DSM 6059]|uniref:DUF2326 domain-containing protein n=1 Tax=Pseudoalteromonas denitrificans DSM 6059 TaxID=1123010 RepID=A0A1I1PWB5_9GAMM|nr:DUF2326 domain-containing protein [Pseudoalteromonas denitrificans]SFD10200.1 hypothetical protein SAMN02745724_03496 [Pseudoalteromonas denitrificans DSM 6059]
MHGKKLFSYSSSYSGFSELAKRFYPEVPAGISIQNNEGNNQERFNISFKIQNDASDGINEVKIFCYDLNNLINSSVNSFQSVFHDSRMFSDIDQDKELYCYNKVMH